MDYQIDPLITSISTLALRTSPEPQGQGLTALSTRQDLFLLTRSPVTNLKESIVILIYQLSDFGVSGHKFFMNLED